MGAGDGVLAFRAADAAACCRHRRCKAASSPLPRRSRRWRWPQTANVVWKRNRNAYARLLLEQLRCGKLTEPFSAQPPGGPLPTLPKHLSYAFKPPRGTASAAPGSPSAAAVSVAGMPAQQQAQSQAPPRALQQQQGVTQQQQAGLTPSQQLDEYVGRADFRRAQLAEEEGSAAAVAAAWVPNAAPASAAAPAAAAQCLPGTRMQLRGAEGRRVDRHQLGDAAWQPSKLELEAALGASRERQAELEWRLTAMETLLRQHASVLGPAGGALGAATPPLGSLLDAIDDGHVSPPRPVSCRAATDAAGLAAALASRPAQGSLQ